MSDSEIKRSRNIGGKNTLLICRDFFNIDIKIPTLGRSSNARENHGQRDAENTKKFQVSVQRSNKKARN